ncbi:1cba5695-da5f-49fa-93a3-1ac2e1f113f5 [Sclerotinia trifoliorum]|uniref:1cba5695-da5f-49fa-93a3-1ac2e1f113f5 n=1 Tax=Sclerotinia trifoliorum TaxID=28548 RepID=A0A8H2ZLC8_9HELO|nr:1cba5695-da5f-49fa-93a3-1ac2e1f113f5 [Sclerotinia trifoliorum]
MAFNAEGPPNVPRNRNQSGRWQLYMEDHIGESAQNTPNEINPNNPPVGRPPRYNNHMHQPRPFTTDDMRTYDQNFPNRMAPDDPRPPFIPLNSSHLNGTADDTARKISGVHHFYLGQKVPSPSPSLPLSSLTRDIRMFRWRSSVQMHMDSSFAPLEYMHDPRTNSELSFGAPRGPGNSDHLSPLPTLSNNNGQSSHSISPLNREQAPKTPNTTSSHKPKPPSASSPDCTICLSPLPAPPKVALVDPCNHEFCLDCIQYWIQTQRKRASVCVQRLTCPLCRGTIQRVIGRDGEVVGSRKRRMMEAANLAAEEQRRWELDLAGHTGSRIEGVPRTLDRVGRAGDVGNQVGEARRRRDRWSGAGTGRSTREEDLPGNGAANWWT